MAVPPDEAATLMRDIAAGREAALARLMALHGPGITRFATRFLGSAAEGDEVAQDTFLRAWRGAGGYDPARAAVSTWLYRIAANLCIDRQRRARIWRLFAAPDAGALAEAIADAAPGTETALAGRQRLAQVREALAALPARQRLAILLAAVAGLDTPEIAVIMAISRGAVEQLLVRARRDLRARVGDDDDG